MTQQIMPKASRNLLVEIIGTETVVYQSTSKEIHRLEEDASRVFAHCDGVTPVSEVAGLVYPSDEKGRDRVDAMLLTMEERGLFEQSTQFSAGRREFLKRAATALLLGSVITTFMAPSPAQAQSAAVVTTGIP